jgi:hypothetical protein
MPRQRDCLQYPDTPLRVRLIRNAGLFLGLTLLFCTFVVPLAQADPEQDPRRTPSEFTTAACYDLVQDAGRMIAWARWERHFSVEKTRSAGFRDNTPQWVIDLVQDWIADAYQWHATDQQVLEWASELGRVENLPHADQLTTHQAIAIWMRRIARHCNAHSPHA